MADRAASKTDPATLRATRQGLVRLAGVSKIGLILVGIGLVLSRARVLLTDVQLTWGERLVLAILVAVYGLGFGLAAWAADRALRAASEILGLMIDQTEASRRAADVLEYQISPAIARLSVVLERFADAATQSAQRQAGRELAVSGVRQAIEEQRWDRAERLLKALGRDYPDAPEFEPFKEEIEAGRQSEVDRLKNRISAAQSANDLDQVITSRDELTLHLTGDDLKALDDQLVTWFMGRLQKRLRAGSISPELAELARRAAESFGDTAQGASLRAALPTLRRGAGLCPRCAQPYRGEEDACPKCLGTAGEAVRNSGGDASQPPPSSSSRS